PRTRDARPLCGPGPVRNVAPRPLRKPRSASRYRSWRPNVSQVRPMVLGGGPRGRIGSRRTSLAEGRRTGARPSAVYGAQQGGKGLRGRLEGRACQVRSAAAAVASRRRRGPGARRRLVAPGTGGRGGRAITPPPRTLTLT